MSLAYDMFDEDLKESLKSSRILEGIYHKGYSKGWDGKATLKELIKKHGRVNVPPEKLSALGEIFNVILWGELAAWKVSANLAFDIKPLEAKMAATSQAHDEARHFYVMKDYLNQLGYLPGKVNPATEALLNNVIKTKCLGKKLLGMQLMVEPVAITIFRFVRESKVEPILCDLLSLYERDEARHIALGVHYLPEVINNMTTYRKISLALFHFKLLSLEVEGLRSLKPSFMQLGIDPHEVYCFAEKKQMDALTQLAEELGAGKEILNLVARFIRIQKDLAFSNKHYSSFAYYITSLLRRIILGS